MGQFLGYIGRRTLTLLDHFLSLAAFTYRMLILIIRRPREGRSVDRWGSIDQIYFTGVQALPIIIPISLIIGCGLIVVFSTVHGQYDMGKMAVILIIRELGPFITAIVVILRSATAVTIEISYMNAFNELDAIEMAGIDPMRLLGVPRLVGITTAIICLFVIFDLVSIVGGYSVVWALTYLPMGNLLEQIGKAITMTDIAVGLIKAICFGIIITVICLYYGFKAEKRITHIPQVTSGTAVECFFFCLVLNIGISAAFYM